MKRRIALFIALSILITQAGAGVSPALAGSVLVAEAAGKESSDESSESVLEEKSEEELLNNSEQLGESTEGGESEESKEELESGSSEPTGSDIGQNGVITQESGWNQEDGSFVPFEGEEITSPEWICIEDKLELQAVIPSETASLQATGSNIDTLYPYHSYMEAGAAVKEGLLQQRVDVPSDKYAISVRVGIQVAEYDKEAMIEGIKEGMYAHTRVPLEGDSLQRWAPPALYRISRSIRNEMTCIQLTVYFNPRNEFKELEEEREWLYSFVPTLYKKGASDYEKALAIFNWVIRHVTYGKYDGMTGQTSYEAYKGVAVCGGISALVYDMMMVAGVNCRTQMNEQQNHMWIIAEIEGSWYIIEATGGVGMKNKEKAVEKDFLIGSDNFNNVCQPPTSKTNYVPHITVMLLPNVGISMDGIRSYMLKKLHVVLRSTSMAPHFPILVWTSAHVPCVR